MSIKIRVFSVLAVASLAVSRFADSLSAKAYEKALDSDVNLFNAKVDRLDALHDASEARVSKAREDVRSLQRRVDEAKRTLAELSKDHDITVASLQEEFRALCVEHDVPYNATVFTDDAAKAVAKEAAETQAQVG